MIVATVGAQQLLRHLLRIEFLKELEFFQFLEKTVNLIFGSFQSIACIVVVVSWR
jgi:hypothetical protein